MATAQYEAKRKSAQSLPKHQRLRLAHPADRAAAREDRRALNDTLKGVYRAPTIALAALETGNNRLIRAVKRLVMSREARRGKGA